MNRLLAQCAALLSFLVLVNGAARAQAADLLISEYVEGSSSNKAIEIYNGTGAAVDLAGGTYVLQVYSNANASPTNTISLTGTLGAGDVFVVCNTSIVASVTVCDLKTGSLSHNGNDSIVLRKGGASGTVLDSIGKIADNPATEWGSGLVSTADNTLRRKATVCAGDTDPNDAVDLSTWDGYSSDTFDGLGAHAAACSGGISINDVTAAENDSGATVFRFTVSLSSPAPAGGVSFDISTSDGTATTADGDYVAHSLTGQTIPTGSDSYSFDVTVNGDTSPEVNESFNVTIGNVVGDTVVDANGLGTIQNDDGVLIVPISQIQGDCDNDNNGVADVPCESPYVDQTLTTEGVVTLVRSNNFYIQSTAARDDADPATSDGILVFNPLPAGMGPGDVVQVTGPVIEYLPVANTFPVTQFGSASNIVDVGDAPLPAAKELTAADFSAALLTPDVLEHLEGMYVHIASGRIVSPSRMNFNGSANEFEIVVDGVDRPMREEGVGIFDGYVFPRSFTPVIFDANQERIKLYPATGAAPQVDARGTVSDVYGTLTYYGAGFVGGPTGHGSAMNSWQVYYDPAQIGIVSGLPAPVSAQGANDVTIAGYNLEWFGSDPDLGSLDDRIAKTAAVICDWLKTPDILGTVEVDGNPGGAGEALQPLADYVNQHCPSAPNYVAYMLGSGDQSVGFLVKTSSVGGLPRVQLLDVDPAVGDQFVHQHGAGTFQMLADPTDPAKLRPYPFTDHIANPSHESGKLLNDRPPLRLKALVNFDDGRQYPVTVVVVHQKALGDNTNSSSSPLGYKDYGAQSRAKRAEQAYELAQLVKDAQAGNLTGTSPGEKVVIVGDFNAFGFNDGYVDAMGITIGNPAPDAEVLLPYASPLTPADGLVVDDDETYNFIADPEERYSYNFDSINQALDHVLFNQALLADPAKTDISVEHARVNSDFRTNLQTVFNAPYDMAANLPVRTSDHDPVRVRITLAALSDSTPPVIVAQPTGMLGDNGWYTSNVGVIWSVTDEESAISSTTGCGTSGIYSDTPGTLFTCTATSAGGTVSESVTIKRDATLPTIVATTNLAPNGAGWYRRPVTVVYSCADATSGVVLCPGKQTYATEGANQASLAYRVKDNAGNISVAADVLDLDIDLTRPTVIAAPTTSPNGSGWYTGNVTVHYSCSDALSGVATCPADVVVTGRGAAVKVPVRSGTDVAGNGGSNIATTLQIDSSAPALNPVFGPALSGGTVKLGTALTVSPNASDSQSGIADQSCDAADTATPGTKAVTCSATNGAGLTTTRTVTYRVVYDVAFAAPLAQNGYYEAEVGQPLRVQWQVRDAAGTGVEGLAAGTVMAFGAYTCPAGTPTPISSYEATQTTSIQALGNGSYWRTMQAPAGYAGTCKQIRLNTGDGIRIFVVRYH